MPGRESDYVTSELRGRFDELKTAIREGPTTPPDLKERARLAWEWANALALSGGRIPVEMPFFIEAVFLGERAGRFSVLRRDPAEACVELDKMIRELILKDEHPAALGSFTLAADSPLPVNSWQTLEQTYTFGEVAMKPGGGFLISKANVANQGELQWTDAREDNYVTISTNRPKARLLPTTVPIKGFRGGIRAPVKVLVFRLVEGELGPGDRVTVTYGDRSVGGRGIRLQSFTNDCFYLPVYVDFEGDENFVTLDFPLIEVTGGPVTALHMFVPAVAAAGERFSACVRSEDCFGNRASGPLPEYEVTLEGATIDRIPAGASPIETLTGLAIDEPGVYRFGVRSADGVLQCTSDPIWVLAEPKYSIYFGDMHGHCGLADGQGSPAGYYRFGRDDASLDFMCLTEHDVFLDDSKWKLLKDTARDFKKDGVFTPILGFECTAPPGMGGHHNVYFGTTDPAYVPLHRALPLPRLFEILAEENEQKDVFVVPHAHQAADWTKADTELIRLVEIHSQHGSFESFARKYLQEGRRIGFSGGGDNHQGHPGYSIPTTPDHIGSRNGLTAALAHSGSQDALFSALRESRTYATSGERILLDFEVNGISMGGNVKAESEMSLHGKVSGTRPIHQIELIRSGVPVLTRSYCLPPEKRCWLRIAFASDSGMYEHDNPRGYRIWHGRLDFSSALVRKIDTPGLFAQHLEHAQISDSDPQRVVFEVRTRGHADVILIELDDVSVESTLSIHCEETAEYADSRYLRERQQIPQIDLSFRLADLALGRIRQEIMVGDYRDSVEISVADPNGSFDDVFNFVDYRPPITAGEYYYMRVEQIDGSLAWTSPIWVT